MLTIKSRFGTNNTTFTRIISIGNNPQHCQWLMVAKDGSAIRARHRKCDKIHQAHVNFDIFTRIIILRCN
eukprot:UN01746